MLYHCPVIRQKQFDLLTYLGEVHWPACILQYALNQCMRELRLEAQVPRMRTTPSFADTHSVLLAMRQTKPSDNDEPMPSTSTHP